jgi:hypothetical protein
MLNTVKYVDFMTLSNEIMLKSVEDNPEFKEYIKFFENLEEVKEFCYKNGIDWLRVYDKEFDESVSQNNWVFISTFEKRFSPITFNFKTQ